MAPKEIIKKVQELYGPDMTARTIEEGVWVVTAKKQTNPPIPIGQPIVIVRKGKDFVFVNPPDSYKYL